MKSDLFGIPFPIDDPGYSYELRQQLLYYWFTKGWSVEQIAERTTYSKSYVEFALEQYESKHRDANTVSAIPKTYPAR
jgi:hypothetical protein